MFDLAITAGYNPNNAQARSVWFQFVTGNQSSTQPANDGLPFFGYCLGHGDFSEIRIKQIVQNVTYEIYYYSPPFPGVGVLGVRTNATWTHETMADSAPSGTWINPTITHSILSSRAVFRVPVICDYDLRCGDLTANAIYGGAAVQIQNQMNAAVAMSPFWAAGKVDGASLSILSSQGRVGFSVARSSAQPGGVYDITFDQPHPNGAEYILQISAEEACDDFIRTGSYEPTANGLQVAVKSGVFVDRPFHILVVA